MSTRHPIVEAILNRRKELGWSQLELATRAGMPPATIGRYETGNAAPTIISADVLLRAMGKQLDVADAD